MESSALGGPTVIGTFKHLPPVLTAKYNFLPNSSFRPYVGAGVNLTLLMDVNLNVPTVGALKLSQPSIGPALQAGFDYMIADSWFINVDFKYVWLHADVTLDGATISTVHANPLLSGIGIAYRF